MFWNTQRWNIFSQVTEASFAAGVTMFWDTAVLFGDLFLPCSCLIKFRAITVQLFLKDRYSTSGWQQLHRYFPASNIEANDESLQTWELFCCVQTSKVQKYGRQHNMGDSCWFFPDSLPDYGDTLTSSITSDGIFLRLRCGVGVFFFSASRSGRAACSCTMTRLSEPDGGDLQQATVWKRPTDNSTRNVIQ